MDFVFALATTALVFLVATIIAYVHNSNSIIRKQEKQIARQQSEIFRLQAKVDRYVKRRPSPQVIEIHDDRIDPENIPEYNNI